MSRAGRQGRAVAIIEARMGSSRLHGKVLLPAAGRPLLEHLVRRVLRAPSIEHAVVATSTNPADDPIAALCSGIGAGCFRGSEDNVMERVLRAAEESGADLIANITGDCPLIDASIVEQVVRLFRNNTCDYATNGHVRTYPGGFAVQVYHIDTLRRSFEMTRDPLEHEHVTLHIRRHPELFRHIYLPAPPELHWPEIDLSLDERADYELIRRIFDSFPGRSDEFTCADVVTLLRANPAWTGINRHVRRKGDT